jgi:glycosyltransferase involved in cell wall biosynthesis
VLFAGALTQRKGLADVFQAFRRLNSNEIELVVMGSLRAPIEFYKSEYQKFTYEPPRSHDEVLRLMAGCDIFLLPSLVEGRALVQLEALGVGLPLIISSNTGGDDLISKETFTGFDVGIRSPEEIAARLQWFIDNRQDIDEIKAQCRSFAETITWESYRKSILKLLASG